MKLTIKGIVDAVVDIIAPSMPPLPEQPELPFIPPVDNWDVMKVVKVTADRMRVNSRNQFMSRGNLEGFLGSGLRDWKVDAGTLTINERGALMYVTPKEPGTARIAFRGLNGSIVLWCITVFE